MERVELDTSVFDRRSDFGKREKEVEIPELNELMGVKEGVVIVRVRQLDLGEYLDATTEIVEMQRNLIEGIVEAASDKDLVRDEAIKMMSKLSPSVKRQVIIAQKGLVNPKLKTSDLIWLADLFPFAVTKIVSAIMELTSSGGVKKNSQG